MGTFFKTGNSIQGFILLNRIIVGPSINSYYKLLEDMSDESNVSAKGKSALRLSRAYAKFGNLEKARYWYQKGIETGDGSLKRIKNLAIRQTDRLLWRTNNWLVYSQRSAVGGSPCRIDKEKRCPNDKKPDERKR